MKGKILHVTEMEVLIRAEDGNKYRASREEVKSSFAMNIGDEVDFDIFEGQAKDVYSLRESTVIENFARGSKITAQKTASNIKERLGEERWNEIRSATINIKTEFKTKFNDLLSGKVAIQNKFCFFSMLFLFISGFVSLISVYGNSINFYEIAESNIMAFLAISTMVIVYFTTSILLFRIFCGLTIFSVVYPIINVFTGLKDASNAMSELGMSKSMMNNLSGMLSDMVSGSAIVFILALVLAIFSILPGTYKTGAKSFRSATDYS